MLLFIESIALSILTYVHRQLTESLCPPKPGLQTATILFVSSRTGTTTKLANIKYQMKLNVGQNCATHLRFIGRFKFGPITDSADSYSQADLN